MSNVLIYPQDRQESRRAGRTPVTRPAMQIDTYRDPLMGLGWLIAAVGLLCMLSAIALATLNLA